MRLDVLPLPLALSLLLSVDCALGAPSSHNQRSSEPPSNRGVHIPITRRAAPQRNDADPEKWAKQKRYLEVKYGVRSEKRSQGYNLCARRFFSDTFLTD